MDKNVGMTLEEVAVWDGTHGVTLIVRNATDRHSVEQWSKIFVRERHPGYRVIRAYSAQRPGENVYDVGVELEPMPSSEREA